jgi:hypothetical protein
MYHRMLILICIAAVFSGCSPHSAEEFQQEGERLCELLCEDLRRIETRDQLIQEQPLLQKHFQALVSLMIEASRFQEEHPDTLADEAVLEPGVFSVALESELQRIYQEIEGARDSIEKAAHEALIKLDAYERARLKRREKL